MMGYPGIIIQLKEPSDISPGSEKSQAVFMSQALAIIWFFLG